jgi:manganese transport protein
VYKLLILSQVILSMQLPFAVIPLIHFTNDPQRMGTFANARWVRWLAWITAAVIVALNVRLAAMTLGDWLSTSGPWQTVLWMVMVPVVLVLVLLLVWVTAEPLVRRWIRSHGRAAVTFPDAGGVEAAAPVYQRILVPLDHSELDRLALGHAAAMAKQYDARIFLLHIEEGVTSQVYGEKSSTAEVQAGQEYLEKMAESLRSQGVAVDTAIAHSLFPAKEIVRWANEVHPDLVIMGAHGHGGLKDLIFGNTINPVRHHLSVPMLIVRAK